MFSIALLTGFTADSLEDYDQYKVDRTKIQRLDLIGGIQSLIRFIVVDVKRIYIAENDKKRFVKAYMAEL